MGRSRSLSRPGAHGAALLLVALGAGIPPGLRGHAGRSVGMEVHEVRNPTVTCEPGYIFPIEPQMTPDDGSLPVRLEEMILITEQGKALER